MGETDGQRQTSEMGSMHPFPQLLPLPRQLRHASVRDLAWTLLSPAMMSTPPGPQRHPLAASHWADDPAQLTHWLQALDRNPQALDDWLALRGSRRLGLYYERLWQFALDQAPGIELLAHNLPIREGGRTLGELDVVLRDRTGVQHLELAIKLYLGPTQGTGADAGQWLGPGCHDRLGSKLAHLADHQLPMAAQTQGRAALAARGIERVTSHSWLAGYLFTPWRDGCAAPSGAAADRLGGRWLRRRDWPAFAAGCEAGRWQPLPRERWLAPARVEPAALWTPEQFGQWLDALEPSFAARLLIRLQPATDDAWHEAERVFLVADRWPALD